MAEHFLLPRTDPAILPFDAVANDDHTISKYQMYAVEKWLVDRSRAVHVLLVYTGDPEHKITLTQYTPNTPQDYDKAVHLLRRDGARPKQTEHGVLMVTSLAHFRSDYTIVKIPDGDFSAAKDQLYANINLLRMGCSGRSALSLDEPSDPTKDRFLSAYQLHLPPSKAKDRITFTNTVLELVKLIQAGLSLFACYGSLAPPSPSVILDGLLCDDTVEGIHRWIAEVGEPCLGLEPTERVADPSFVSALLSTVLSTRNKLHALVASSPSSSTTQLTPVPKDPFVYPYAFTLALSSYLQFCSTQASQSPVPGAFLTTQMAPFIVTGILPAVQPSVSSTKPPVGAILTEEVLEHIDACYDKSKSADNRRVRRVFKGKLDDLTRGPAADSDGDDHRGTISDTEASPHHHAHLHVTPSSSIGASSGNRVLGGITTLLSKDGGSGGGGAGGIIEPQTSLSSFLSTALSKESGATNTGGRIRRIRDSVGAGAAGEHSVRTAVGKGMSRAIGKTKRQRHESVDMGSFYSGGALAAAGIIPITGHPVSTVPPPTAESSSAGGQQAGGGAVEKEWADKETMKEKEVVVGGSVKALWGGRVGDLVKMREWCADVARIYHLESSALVLPSSSYQPGGGGGQRVASGSTVGSHNSGSHLKEKSKRKEKLAERFDREKGIAKEKLKLSPSALLGIHSDTDQVKSDTGRSTEGEESEPIYYASPSRSSGRPTPRPHSVSAFNVHSLPHQHGLPQPPDMISSNPMASASFGSLLGGRVRGKLGNWAGGLTKRKGGSQSVDLNGGATPATSPPMSGHAVTGSVSVASSAKASPNVTRSGMPGDEELLDDTSLATRPPAPQRGRSVPVINTPQRKGMGVTPGGKSGSLSVSVSPSGHNPLSMSQNSNMSTLGGMSPPLTATASRMTADSQPQSPTLPPLNYGCEMKSGGEEDDGYEVEVLSSGQISPLSDHRSSSAFVSSRSRPPLSRHFSLASSSQQASQLAQDRNYLSVATINEKLSRLSADQRAGDSSARSSRTNLNAPFYPSRKRLFLRSGNSNASNVQTGEEDEGVLGVGAGAKQGQAPPKRPKLGYMGRSSSTVLPRISSWSDPLSAALMRGASGYVTPLEHIEPLDLGGRSDFDDMENVSAPHPSSFPIRDRGSNLSGLANSSSLGGEFSEGEVLSDSYVSKPPSLAPRPSVRARRKTEQGNVAQVGQGSGSWTRDDDGGVKRERARFHSLLSVVDRDGNYFLEEPTLAQWEAQHGHLRDAGELDGEDGEYNVGYGYDLPVGMGLGGVEDDADDDVLVEGGVDIDDADWVRRRRRRRGMAKNVGRWADLRRRRSFADLDDWSGMEQLNPERMRVDVEMCGQVLVMIRREEHLRNVIGCLEILNSSLSQTNTLLRQEYDSHLTALSQLSHRTKVLADLDLQSTRTDNLSQQTNVLRYEAEQFSVPSLYHAALLSRQKVLELRHKVFGVHGVFQEPSAAGGDTSNTGEQQKSQHKKSGTGSGRILPEGVRGAHGKFNRLQKRLDGTDVVVDWLGRTESEVEEEEQFGRSGSEAKNLLRMHGRVEGLLDLELEEAFEEEERRRAMLEEADGVGLRDMVKEREGEEPDVEVVEHSSIRPMWLLRFFMGWGARWSARATSADVSTGSKNGESSKEPSVSPERKESEGSIEESRKDR